MQNKQKKETASKRMNLHVTIKDHRIWQINKVNTTNAN